MAFKLVQGVDADNIENVHSAYSIDENGIYSVLSAEIYEEAVSKLVEKLVEPVFFFLEIPCSAEEEKILRKSKSDPYHYNIYYLDNCTIPVADAIMKRYGELLVNDGVCRFGFGSHNNEEEIYCKSYQTVSVYGNIKKFKAVLDEMNIPCEAEIKTIWDVLSSENTGTCSTVEINGETVNDIAVNLKLEGMYLADTVEEK
ncbi:MAG: hypothetical protein K2F81_03055 [Ruminococcus sp.]|nr:hypothetical protein [Ruminococcus sp.]